MQFPYENWMGDIAQSIDHKRLSEICIPATHNSGAFGLRATDPASAYWGLMWANNQSVPIYFQLLSGIRVLDLRLMYVGRQDDPSPSLNDVLITHSRGDNLPHMTTFLGAPVEGEVKAIREFLKDHPKEIVIVWIHKTERFRPAVHKIVAECLKRYLLVYHLPHDVRAKPIGELVKSNKRAIVRYEDMPPDLRSGYSWMWVKSNEAWIYTYADKMVVAEVIKEIGSFLDRNAPNRNNGELYYAELQMTESETDITKSIASQPISVAIMGFVAGLAGMLPLHGAVLGAIIGLIANRTQINSTMEMAMISNIATYAWLANVWAKKANIVAVDFFQYGGAFLEIVKGINEGRLPVAVGTETR